MSYSTDDFLLAIHSNYGPISTVSEINGGINRKTKNLPIPVFNTPGEGILTAFGLKKQNEGPRRW